MVRWMAAAIVVLLAAQGARAAEPGPVCRAPAVVQEMTREIRVRDYYTHVDPALVTEQLSDQSNVVLCQVCVQAAPYDMVRFPARPIRQCRMQAFEVRILRAGFMVRDLW